MADEARKQQFAATSLVMGLVPLTLKDVAWPERRIVVVSRQLRKPVEIIVRALGIVPSIGERDFAESGASTSTSLYRKARKTIEKSPMLVVTTCAVGLILTYAALAILEVYSKRSSLGCVYPIFIVTWHLLAIIPAIVDTIFSGTPTRSYITDSQPQSTIRAASFDERPGALDPPKSPMGVVDREALAQGITGSEHQVAYPIPIKRPTQQTLRQSQSIPLEDISPIQGRGKTWLVQLVWAIYYIAGTLVYTSIMAVTVVELVAWVMASIAATAASKLLAFFLCMAIEKGHKSP